LPLDQFDVTGSLSDERVAAYFERQLLIDRFEVTGPISYAPLEPGIQRTVPGESGGFPWLVTFVVLAVGWLTVRSLRRSPTLASVGGPAIAAYRSTSDAVVWYDSFVARAGHPRPPNEPILSHARRLSDKTGDSRYRTLGRLVSDHVYSGRPLPVDAQGLFDSEPD
jgi:hypothetical protein